MTFDGALPLLGICCVDIFAHICRNLRERLFFVVLFVIQAEATGMFINAGPVK